MPKFRKLILATVAAMTAAAALPAPALAQFSDAFKFLEAIKKRNDADVQTLYEKGGSTLVNTRDSSSLDTALHIAARQRNMRYVTFLISARANTNLRNAAGETPLVIACNGNFLEAVPLLIAAGARVDEPNSTGETPLITAVHNRNIELIRMLLQAGANPDRKDNSGRSARDYAALDPKSETLLATIKDNAKAKVSTSKPVFGPN